MAMCALVFQNVVPVVAANLAFDRQKVSLCVCLTVKRSVSVCMSLFCVCKDES